MTRSTATPALGGFPSVIPRRLSLRDCQRNMVEYAFPRDKIALFVDMRLGKTLAVIRWAKSARRKRILIVAPYSALAGWEQQLIADGEICIEYLTGTKEQRLKNLWKKSKWSLINKEGYRSIPDIKYVSWDAIIIDGSTFIKSHTSQVTQVYLKNFKDVPYKAILTGTPAPESELEYYCQLEFLSPGIWGTSNFYEWRFKNFAPSTDGARWFATVEGRKRIAAVLEKHCFFLSRKDANLGGEKIYRTRKIQLPSAIRTAYSNLEKSFILEISGKEIDKTLFATTAFIWMRRLCGGVVDGKLRHKAKLDDLVDLLTGELANEQVVVWAVFVDEIKAITERLFKKRIPASFIYGGVSPRDREGIRQRFSDGVYRVLVCQPECFRHGIDLSTAETMIYYSSPTGLETRLQTEDRIVDVTKRNSLLIIDMVAENSVDEDIAKALGKKEGRSEMMRTIIKGMQCR